VQAEHAEESEAHEPQHETAGHEAAAEGAEGFGVFVHAGGAFVYVKVADHVDEYEADEAHAGEGHDPFAAYGGLVNVYGEGPAFFAGPEGGYAVTLVGGLRHGFTLGWVCAVVRRLRYRDLLQGGHLGAGVTRQCCFGSGWWWLVVRWSVAV